MMNENRRGTSPSDADGPEALSSILTKVAERDAWVVLGSQA
jgi:hypothetical protein